MPADGNDYKILGSPGLAYGFAAGDLLRVANDGSYQTVQRGENLCLRAYPTTAFAEADIAALIAAFEPLGGLVETPHDRRFVVITVPATSGFPAVETAIDSWAASRACDWEYGNIYDEQGNSLDWWNE